MLFILPWSVDVIEDRYPVVNWLFIVVTIGVFVIQVRDFKQYRARPRRYAPRVQSAPQQPERAEPATADRRDREPSVPGITGALMLDGWGLKGLLGHMWLHGGLFHLLGNVWFLWLFGNAVCAKVGNLKYAGLYVLLGVIAGVTHLLFSGGRALGASGAINGVVGMYLVLYFEHEITCYFVFWFIYLYVHQFALSSYWMILFWLFWDMVGAFGLVGDSNVAYFAHLGGFGAGFGIAFAMCRLGWITMDRYETSLWDAWQKRRRKQDKPSSLDRAYAQLGMVAPKGEPVAETPGPPDDARSEPAEHDPHDRSAIRATCSCGRTLSVSWQYAGKVAQCPDCGQGVGIPNVPRDPRIPPARPRAAAHAQVSPAGQHIRFTCSCGRRIKAPARYAGRSGKCPRCGRRIRVPGDTGNT